MVKNLSEIIQDSQMNAGPSQVLTDCLWYMGIFLENIEICS